MIYWKELVKNNHQPDQDAMCNLYQLHYRLNLLREIWQNLMYITSGYRSEYDHRRIYEAVNKSREELGLSPRIVPMGSHHLIGSAADVGDKNGVLKRFIKDNISKIEEIGLWMEDFIYTGGPNGGWIHFQIYPPISGSRFFKP